MTTLNEALGAEPETPQAEPETPQEQPEPTVEAQEAPAEPSPEPQKGPEMVPVSVVAGLREEIRQLKQQTATPPPQPPEFIDPEGGQFLLQQVQHMQANMVAQNSEMRARLAHGSEAVDAAYQAAEAAGVVDQFRGQKDPWGALTSWHKAQQVQAEIGGDPAAYKARLEAEIRAKVQAEMVAEAAQKRAASPAPSMANVTGSSGGPVPTWNGPTPLDDVFGGN